MSPMPKLFRLQTSHGTQVYLDPQGRLRHGQADANPDNIRAQVSEAQLVLWHDTGADGFRGLGFACAPDGSLLGRADGQDGSDVVSGEPQVFDIETVGPVIGLRYHRTYLCGELDGRVVLDREALNEWERFELIEAEPAPPPVPLAEPVIEALTLEQLAPAPRTSLPPTIELTAAEAAMRHEPAGPPPADQDWLAQANAPDEPAPPPLRRAERLVASSTSLGPIKLLRPEPAPRPGVWRRFMRSLLGD